MPSKQRVSIDQQNKYDQWLNFSLTLSAANTFTQTTINTNVTPDNEFILVVKEIQFSLDVGFAITQATFQNHLSITRNSKAAMPSLADNDLIAFYKSTGYGAGVPANASAGIIEQPINMVFSGKQIIAQPQLYIQGNSVGISAPQAIVGRIYYETERMSKSDILEILYG